MIIRKRAECWIVNNNKIWVGVKGNIIALPGGTWEQGETLRETAIRETKEEVGIICNNLKLITKDLIVRDNWNGWTHSQTFSYQADFVKFDDKQWGDGPEGKYHRVHMDLDKLLKYFQTLKSKEDHFKEIAEQNIWIINYILRNE